MPRAPLRGEWGGRAAALAPARPPRTPMPQRPAGAAAGRSSTVDRSQRPVSDPDRPADRPADRPTDRSVDHYDDRYERSVDAAVPTARFVDDPGAARRDDAHASGGEDEPDPADRAAFRIGANLLTLLDRLVKQGNSVIVIEHDPTVLSYCDWLIELGPGGGGEGGEIIAQGSPLDLKQNPRSQTGPFLEVASP